LHASRSASAGDLRTAVCLARCLEDSARLELSVLAAGLEPVPLTPHEAAQRATWHGGLVDRMWAFPTDGDAEASLQSRVALSHDGDAGRTAAAHYSSVTAP